MIGNMLNIDKGKFLESPNKAAYDEPLWTYMSNLLSVQDNLLKIAPNWITLFEN